MARPNRIWWWEKRGEFFVTIQGQRHRLGPDKEKAERKFHTLMASPPTEKADPQSVVGTMDIFLSEAAFKSSDTKQWYQKYLQSFTDFLKGQGLVRLSIDDLAPFHVNKWLRSHEPWGDSTRNGACRAVQRAFRWANQMGYIKVNPLAFIPDKPPAGKRENIITAKEYETLFALVKDEEFRDLLTVSWECGCRPQEILRVTKANVDDVNRRWVFNPKEGKKLRKGKTRYVYLTDLALEICCRLMLKHPEGPIFRNRKGRPWTTFAVNCRFVRLSKKIGRKIALYDLRHSFTERLRQAGVDSVNIAALLGHADLSMLGRTYAHPHTNPEHLLDVLKKGTA